MIAKPSIQASERFSGSAVPTNNKIWLTFDGDRQDARDYKYLEDEIVEGFQQQGEEAGRFCGFLAVGAVQLAPTRDVGFVAGNSGAGVGPEMLH